MTMTFGNRSLVRHIARGVLGFGSLYLALHEYETVGWPALMLLPVTLWMLKGCPVCWTIGLFETIAFSVLGKDSPAINPSVAPTYFDDAGGMAASNPRSAG